MSYQALYRKWRPRVFSDVKGQEHIVTTLQNQIKTGRIGHAYIFCGTRGTGKTTVAKIFANAVNCENPTEDGPCGECAACRAIAEGRSYNVIEMDAASNNGVDSIRQIREEVAYPPAEGKYKVYIIDEAHMLTPAASNALLKTLEEPPSYIIFILATTEPSALPITVRSRCQRYDFKRISLDTIAGRVRDLAEKEGIRIEDKAVKYIARAADGAMRDALSLLERCAAYYTGTELSYDKVLEIIGAVDTSVFEKLLVSTQLGNAGSALNVIDDIVADGREIGQFVNDFIWYLRNLLVINDTDDPAEILDVSAENAQAMQDIASKIDDNVLMRYIRVFSDLSASLRYASQKRVLLEIAVIKLMKPEMEKTYDSLIDRIDRLERQIEAGEFTVRAQGAGSISEHVQAAAPEPEKLEKALPEQIKKIVGSWRRILNEASPTLEQALKRAEITQGEGNRLIVGFDNAFGKGLFEGMGRADEFKKLIEKALGAEVEITAELREKEKKDDRGFIDPNVIKLDGLEVTYEN